MIDSQHHLESSYKQDITSNCLRLLMFWDVPPMTVCEETTSLLPCNRFKSFWHMLLDSAALFSASSVATNCCTWAFCKKVILISWGSKFNDLSVGGWGQWYAYNTGKFPELTCKWLDPDTCRWKLNKGIIFKY